MDEAAEPVSSEHGDGRPGAVCSQRRPRPADSVALRRTRAGLLRISHAGIRGEQHLDGKWLQRSPLQRSPLQHCAVAAGTAAAAAATHSTAPEPVLGRIRRRSVLCGLLNEYEARLDQPFGSYQLCPSGSSASASLGPQLPRR